MKAHRPLRLIVAALATSANYTLLSRVVPAEAVESTSLAVESVIQIAAFDTPDGATPTRWDALAAAAVNEGQRGDGWVFGNA